MIRTIVGLLFGMALLLGLVVTAVIVFNHPAFRRMTQHTYVTAQEVIEEIDSDNGYYPSSGSVELPPDELDLVVKELRARYPLESLSARLPDQFSTPNTDSESTATDDAELTEEAQQSLRRLERDFQDFGNRRRVKSLAQLHGDEVKSFINREGFGFSRRPPVQSSPKGLKLDGLYEFKFSPLATTSGHLEGAIIDLEPHDNVSANGLPGSRVMSKFHQTSVRHFASPETVGFVKDIDHVAGFQPHQMFRPHTWNGSVLISKRPTDPDWKINRVELVSLLAHEHPRVYVSDELPTMVAIEDRQTRRLNDFELRGLKKLKTGESIFVTANKNRIEMLGAVRAAASCLQCHEGQRGRLLGAFSYEIFRDPQFKRESNNPAF